MNFWDSLFCLSLSARDGIAASVRESASLAESEVQKILEQWRLNGVQSSPSASEDALFYVGTCHRVELYGYGLDPDLLLGFWEKLCEANLQSSIRLIEGAEVLRHLVRVSASLESEVLGETQITGQVKVWAEKARTAGNLRGPLDQCIQQALRATKRIRSSTALGEGVVSVAHVAVDGLSDVFDALETKRALVVGAGSMAVQAIHRLQRRGLSDIHWVNRTESRLREHPLAAECQIQDYAKLHELVWQYPITITATSSDSTIVTREGLKVARQQASKNSADGPRVILDLGLPRNVDERIHGFAGFYVRNVDEFGNRVEENTKQRLETLKRAEEILEEELNSILKLFEARERGPLLGELREHLDTHQMREIAERKLEKSEGLEYVSRALNSRLLHRLVEELDRVGEPLASQVLETLVRAWRQPEACLKNDLQARNPPEKRAKLVRLR